MWHVVDAQNRIKRSFFSELEAQTLAGALSAPETVKQAPPPIVTGGGQKK